MITFFKRQQTDWLTDYPVYAAPHVGIGRTLTEAQAHENLDYLLANKPRRLDALSTLLENFNVDLAAGFACDNPEKLISELYQWSGEQWLTYYGKERTREQWLKCNRAQNDLIYSVAMDTAIALGDLTIQHRPTYAWGVDLDQSNIKMTTWRRCVIMAPKLTHDHMAIADVEHEVAARIFKSDSPTWQWKNQWLAYMRAYLDGAHEGAHLV